MRTNLLFVCLLISLPLHAFAGSLRVIVEDPTGAVISNASVRLSAGRVRFTALTNGQGQAAFAEVPIGSASIHAEALGFAPKDQNVTLTGDNEIHVGLLISTVTESVMVEEDPREAATDPRSGGAAVLTQKDLAAFSDNPDEFQRQIEAMAGPGALLRINGFVGGRLPPKSQIQSIRFRLTPFSAEEHDDGLNSVEITTYPGAGSWHGQLAYGYGSDVLNARNALALVREHMETKRVDFSVSGPLVANKTAISLGYLKTAGYDSQATRGFLLSGPFSNLVKLPARSVNSYARINQKLGASHLLLLEYQSTKQDVSTLGTYDLADRLSTSSFGQDVIRIGESGLIGHNAINNLRFQTQWSSVHAGSSTSAAAVVVPGAFNAGGAGKNSMQRVRDLDASDSVTFSRGVHSVRVGGEVNAAWRFINDQTNANGTFVFPGLAAYAAETPVQFTQRVGNQPVNYSQYQFSGFVQDDLRLKQNLSVSLGVRYETQTNVGDRLKFAPRVGLAWSPFRNGKTTIRAGFGIYPQWLDPTVFQQTLLLNGTNQSNVVVLHPGYPNPYSAGTSTVSALPPSTYTIDPRLTMSYLVRSSVAVQQQIGSLFMVTSDVRAERGIHLIWSQDINAPIPGGTRPDLSKGQIWQVESGANSTLYNWTVRLLGPGRPSQRYLWTISYVYARSMNEVDGPLVQPSRSDDLRADLGPSLLDMRHRLTALALWSLPKGLQVGTVLRANSAAPYNVTTGSDTNGDGVINDRPVGLGRNSARGVGTWNMDLRFSWTRSVGKWRTETTQSVIRFSEGGVPNLPPGLGFNPRLLVQFYSQATNLLNHSNLGNFVGVVTSPQYAQPTSSMPGRRIEVGAKLSF